MLPNFICVGPGRAGTSWLYEVLLEHPDVFTARDIKETDFFNKNYFRGGPWYEAFFAGCSGARAVGEISNRYIFDEAVPRRIKEHIPDCKIIICLRNPYDRIRSTYSFKIREGALNCGISEALATAPELIEENRYYTLVSRFYNEFPSEQIFLMFYDDLVERPQWLVRELFRFLGVDDNFMPVVVDRKVNQAIVPKLPGIASLTKWVARMLRSMGMYKLLTWAKRSEGLKSLLFKPYDHKIEARFSAEDRARIDAAIVPELVSLEKLTGRSLSRWME